MSILTIRKFPRISMLLALILIGGTIFLAPWQNKLDAAEIIAGLKKMNKFKSLQANTKVSIESSISNIKQSFQVRQTVQAPDKLRFDLQDNNGSLIIVGEKAYLIVNGKVERKLNAKEFQTIAGQLGRNSLSDMNNLLGLSGKLKGKRKSMFSKIYTLQAESNSTTRNDESMEFDIDTNLNVITEVRTQKKGETVRAVRYKNYINTEEAGLFPTRTEIVDFLPNLLKNSPVLRSLNIKVTMELTDVQTNVALAPDTFVVRQ